MTDGRQGNPSHCVCGYEYPWGTCYCIGCGVSNPSTTEEERVMKTLIEELRSPEDLPEDGDSVTVVTAYGIYTGHFNSHTPEVELGTIIIDWDEAIGWFYFDAPEYTE